MTEMVVKQFGTVNQNEQVGEKGFNRNFYIFVAAVISVFLVAAFIWSNMPLAKTVTNSIQTTTGVSTSDINTGAATSSQNAIANGQETMAATVTVEEFYAKYKENVNAAGGKESLVAINSILQTKIPLRNFAGTYVIITDLKPSGIKGYIENTEKNSYRLSIVVSGLTADGRLAFEAATPVVLELKGNTKKDFIIGRDDSTTPTKGLIPLENAKFLLVKSR